MLASLIQSPTSTSMGSFPWFDASSAMALRRSVVEPEHPERRQHLPHAFAVVHCIHTCDTYWALWCHAEGVRRC
jgi:hypothetical protein